LPLLVQQLLDLGACSARLQAKVFGGASLFEASGPHSPSLGARNVAVAREWLEAACIPVVAEDVGGERGRKVLFEAQTGVAWVRAIGASA